MVEVSLACYGFRLCYGERMMNQKPTGISEVCTWKLWAKVTSVDQLNYSPCLVTSVLPSSRKPFYCVALSQFRSCQPLNSAFQDPTCQSGWTWMCQFKASSKHGLPSTGPGIINAERLAELCHQSLADVSNGLDQEKRQLV